MKIIYCCSSDNIQELKTIPGDYTSSKINTLFTNTEPVFTREFFTISNMKYVKIRDYPDYKQIWDDMMNKITFAYNFRYLESLNVFKEYEDFNKKYAEEINKICEEEDVVIVNDASLYLLPTMVKCTVAVRNLDFDDCFVERIPYSATVIRALFKANKFFSNRESLMAFHRFLDRSYQFNEINRGGCYYMRKHVDKEAALDALKVCKAYMDSFDTGEVLRQNELLDYITHLEIPSEHTVILTNVPLLHLEAYIKKYPKTNIRYIRASVEIDEKQDRMMQYLRKVYSTRIDIIDKRGFDILVLEMLYCSIFVGSSYTELAKLLRRPNLTDDPDSLALCWKIEEKTNKIEELEEICGECKYLREFLGVQGYGIQCDVEDEIDRQIDEHVMQLLPWFRKSENSVFELMPKSQTSRDSDAATVEEEKSRVSEKSGMVSHASTDEEVLYERHVKNEKIKYRRRSNRKRAEVYPLKKSSDAQVGEEIVEIEEKSRIYKPYRMPEIVDRNRLREFWAESNKVALVDYDGTLTPIVDKPSMAKPTPELLAMLADFSKHGRIILCTGRSTDVVDEWFPNECEVYAEHGAAHRKDGKWEFMEPIEGIDRCIEIMEYYHIRTPGSLIEKKKFGAAFHYKMVKDFNVERLYALLSQAAGQSVVVGKDVIEVRSSTKYEICRKVDPALAVGDDTVDEDLFDGCRGISIHVGARETKADYRVDDVEGFLGILKELAGK